MHFTKPDLLKTRTPLLEKLHLGHTHQMAATFKILFPESKYQSRRIREGIRLEDI